MGLEIGFGGVVELLCLALYKRSRTRFELLIGALSDAPRLYEIVMTRCAGKSERLHFF